MNAKKFIKHVEQAQDVWGPLVPDCAIVIEMPNGARFEAVSGGVSQGPSFLNADGVLCKDTHFVLKPAVTQFQFGKSSFSNSHPA